MSIAGQRQQYNRAQQAMLASEDTVKGLRRQLASHVREISPTLEACLPPAKGPNRLVIGMPHDTIRAGAAYQSYSVQVKGMIAWHDPTAKEVKAMNAVMKPFGWKSGGVHRSNTHWWINFS